MPIQDLTYAPSKTHREVDKRSPVFQAFERALRECAAERAEDDAMAEDIRNLETVQGLAICFEEGLQALLGASDYTGYYIEYVGGYMECMGTWHDVPVIAMFSWLHSIYDAHSIIELPEQLFLYVKPEHHTALEAAVKGNES